VAAQLTIEQLAAQSGMSVRNIRAHQARGLLAPPEVRLRVGYYGPAHIAALRLIRQLQQQGFNLGGIKRLLDDEAGTAERLARFELVLTTPDSEAPQTLTAAELGRRLAISPQDQPRVLARAQRLGVLVAVGEDRFRAPGPSLLAVAEQAVARGVSFDAALTVFEELARQCDAQVKSTFGVLLGSEGLGEDSGRRPPREREFQMSTEDPAAQRAESMERWERSASGWGRRAPRLRPELMPVSAAMIDALDLQPGQRVLELAAGPGDVGFLAAELIAPGGTLICSDGAEAMLEVARTRAGEAGIDNVEFARLQLEWIDLPTASVDAALCRFGIMLIVDPPAAAQEIRRVVRPGGRVALAVWDVAEANPWATIPGAALVDLGHATPPDPDAPGMFRLAAPGSLAQLLEAAGFADVHVQTVQLDRSYSDLDAYVEETRDLSVTFRDWFDRLTDSQRAEVCGHIAELAEPYAHNDGSLRLPGGALVASAGA